MADMAVGSVPWSALTATTAMTALYSRTPGLNLVSPVSSIFSRYGLHNPH
jgi:hypothetical protein